MTPLPRLENMFPILETVFVFVFPLDCIVGSGIICYVSLIVLFFYLFPLHVLLKDLDKFLFPTVSYFPIQLGCTCVLGEEENLFYTNFLKTHSPALVEKIYKFIENNLYFLLGKWRNCFRLVIY